MTTWTAEQEKVAVRYVHNDLVARQADHWVSRFRAVGYLTDCEGLGMPPAAAVVVYRGAASLDGWRALSWTTSVACAAWFARRHVGWSGHGPILFRAVVPPEAVLARFAAQGESEVVVDPAALLDVREVPIPPTCRLPGWAVHQPYFGRALAQVAEHRTARAAYRAAHDTDQHLVLREIEFRLGCKLIRRVQCDCALDTMEEVRLCQFCLSRHGGDSLLRRIENEHRLRLTGQIITRAPSQSVAMVWADHILRVADDTAKRFLSKVFPTGDEDGIPDWDEVSAVAKAGHWAEAERAIAVPLRVMLAMVRQQAASDEEEAEYLLAQGDRWEKELERERFA